MSFGDVLRSAATPSIDPVDVGGDINTIWHCDYYSENIYELDTADFSVIRYASAPFWPEGIGGDTNTIWHSDYYYDEINELDTADFSVIRYVDAPSWATSVGGDTNTIWHCADDLARIYELDTADFSVIRYANSPSIDPVGIGGDANTIWHCDWSNDYIYELDTADFSVIQSTSVPSGAMGIGGDADIIWHTDYNNNNIYELDTGAISTYNISGNVKDDSGNDLENVTITFEDGTDYETSTDIHGNYTQEVDPDTYIVTASKTGYVSDSAIVDASAGDQTQNFTLIRPVISGNVKDNVGHNLPDVNITFENDVSYDTTTDSDGNYSQTVDADVYDVTASVLGSGLVSETESVDATTSDQTQNFILDRTTSQNKGVLLTDRNLLQKDN